MLPGPVTAPGPPNPGAHCLLTEVTGAQAEGAPGVSSCQKYRRRGCWLDLQLVWRNGRGLQLTTGCPESHSLQAVPWKPRIPE